MIDVSTNISQDMDDAELGAAVKELCRALNLKNFTYALPTCALVLAQFSKNNEGVNVGIVVKHDDGTAIRVSACEVGDGCPHCGFRPDEEDEDEA